MSLSANYPALAPNLLLDFANSKVIDSRIGVTRASTATYFNQLGVLQTAQNNVPRIDFNPTTYACNGLLVEESRTNLITSSAALPAGVNVTITADTFVAPDGTTTGDQILDNATLGEHYSDSSFTPVAATNYTFSAFIKNIGASSSGFAVLRLAGDFSAFVMVNLSTFTVATTGGAQYVSSSVQAINNGWYKVSLTGLSVSTTASVARVQVTDVANLAPYSGTGEGFAVWGRQLEAGAFPTSYIPTTTTALTRNADVASMTGTNFSSWYNQTEGTLLAEVALAALSATANQNAMQFSDGTASNRIALYRQSAAIGSALSFGTTIGGASWTTTATRKLALGNQSGNSALAENGAITGTGAGTTVQTVNQFRLGANHDGTGGFTNGWLRRLSYYPVRNTNAQLQALTGT